MKRKGITRGVLSAATLIAAPSVLAANSAVQDYSYSHSQNFIRVEDALGPESKTTDGVWLWNLGITQLNDPSLRTEANNAVLGDSGSAIEAGVAVQYMERLQLGFNTSWYSFSPAIGEDQSTLGQSSIMGKWRVSPRDWDTSLALIPRLTLPSPDDDLLMGDDELGFEGHLALGQDFGVVNAALNIGYHASSSEIIDGQDYGDKVLASLGLAIPVNERFAFNAEYFVADPVDVDTGTTPNEIFLGGRYLPNQNTSVNFGAGFASDNPVYGNDLSVTVGLKYQPGATAGTFVESGMVSEEQGVAMGISPSFEPGSAELSTEAEGQLKRVAERLKENQDQIDRVLIEGHADRAGEEGTNYDLSLQRARRVRDYLVTRGLPRDMFIVAGSSRSARTQEERRQEQQRQGDVVVQVMGSGDIQQQLAE